jgi:serine/threonine-protein kinase
MGLFKGRFAGRPSRGAGGAGGAGGAPAGKRATDPGRPTQDRKRTPRTAHRSPRTVLRFLAWLLGGIAVMAGVGYLVAAVWLVPSPLLPSERVTPRVIGLTDREAARQLEGDDLVARRVSEPHPSAAAGIVTWQDPPPGVAVPKDSEVRIVVSSGLPRAVVPDVRGMDLALVEQLLGAVGLRVESVDTVVAKGRTPGTAAGTSPSAGDSVPLGRGVIVQLAR